MKYQYIVNNINKLLNLRKLTLSDLARETKISLTGIKKMMDNGAFKIENLEKIADVLGFPYEWLLNKDLKIRIETREGKEVVTINPGAFFPPVDADLLDENGKLKNENSDIIYFYDDKNIELNEKIEKLIIEKEEQKKTIIFLNEQLEFFKHQSETLKFLNEQLLKSSKENT